MDDELRGVKGWLAVFVVIMGLVSPALSAFLVYQELNSGQAALMADHPMVVSLKTLAWSLVAADAAIGWFVVYRLLAVHNWLSVQLAIAGIWVSSVGASIVGYAGVASITGFSLGEVLAEAGPRGLVQPLIFGLIWTSYLLKSERVANTYRDPQQQAEIFE